MANMSPLPPHGLRDDFYARRHLDPAIAASLRTARQASWLTLRQLANRTGLSPGYLCQLENGRRVPSTVVVDRLIEALSPGPAEAALWRRAALPGVGKDSPFRARRVAAHPLRHRGQG